MKILIIRTKNSLQNPIVTQTITTILSSTEKKKSSQTKKNKIPYQTPRNLQQTPTQQANNTNQNPLDRYGNPKFATCHSIDQ